MVRKIFTDESLATFVDETKSYVNKQLLEKADKDHFHKIEEVENLQTALDGKADDEHTHDIYETKEDAKIKYDELKAIQSDWNQNDETASDYIKNRTHYEKDNRKYLDIEWDGDVDNCISYEKFEIPEANACFYFCKVSEDVDAVDFNNLANYTIFYKTPSENGERVTEYNLSDISSIQGNALVDNSLKIHVVKDGTLVTSLGVTLTKGIYFLKYDSGLNVELTSRLVSIEPISGEIEIQKIDEKFIPDTIARVDSIPQSDWNQNDETASDYIKNRTHYESTSIVRGEELLLENDISLYDGEYFALDSYALNVGQYVEVVWNDVSYMCEIRQNDSGNACFGDSNLTEYPFYYTEEGTFDTRLYAHAGNHTVTVYDCATSEEIKQLDEKFIPDTIARMSDLENVGGNIDIDSLELITVDDIDTICGSSIEYADMSKGTF